MLASDAAWAEELLAPFCGGEADDCGDSDDMAAGHTGEKLLSAG